VSETSRKGIRGFTSSITRKVQKAEIKGVSKFPLCWWLDVRESQGSFVPVILTCDGGQESKTNVSEEKIRKQDMKFLKKNYFE